MSRADTHSRAPGSGATQLPILAAAVVIGAGVGMIFPLLAEIQDQFGLSTSALGLISGASFLSAVVSGLLLAGLADRGHARALLSLGVLASGGSLIWFAAGTELWHFLAARACEGLAYGAFFPAARKYMVSSDQLAAGRELGRLTSAELGGLLLGPVIGASLTAAFSLDVPFIAVGSAATVIGVWLVFTPLPTIPPSPPQPALFRSFTMLKRRPIAGAALLSLALYLPVGIYDALWSRYLTDRGASTAFIGISLSLYAVPVILLAPWGGRVSDRFGPIRASSVALVFIIPMTVLYGLVPWPVLIAVIAVCEGVPQAVATPGVQAAMVKACHPDEVAAGQGLAGAMNQLGAGAAALVGPLVYGAFGSAAVFIGIAAVMAAVFAVGVRFSRSDAASGDGVVATDVDDPDQPEPDVPLPLGT